MEVTDKQIETVPSRYTRNEIEKSATPSPGLRTNDISLSIEVPLSSNISYEDENGHLSFQEPNTINHRRSVLDLDLNGTNRRSRHFAVSDTADLTSPYEAETVTSSASSSAVPEEETVARTEENKTRTSTNTQRSSSSSTLRQTSNFGLELKPSLDSTDDGSHRIYPAEGYSYAKCDFAPEDEESQKETRITIKPALPSNNPVSKQPKISNQTTDTKDKKLIMLRIPRDSSIHNFARQMSGKKRYDVREAADMNVGVLTTRKRPRSYFDLAIVTMCCCCSLLGFVAVIFSVLSESNFKSKHARKAKKYGKVSLVLSIVGMISSVAIAITLLLVFAYPWHQIADL